MRFLPKLLIVSVLAIVLVSCGGTTQVGFVSNFPAVTGSVSSVHLSVVSDGSTTIQVTVVTLQANGFPHQFTFCGDQASQFPMNTSVTVNFNPGQNCNQIIVVVAG